MRRMPTQADLEAMWRPFPDFIGPVAPPMWLLERAVMAEICRDLGFDPIELAFDWV